jgi:hypothetical protein
MSFSLVGTHVFTPDDTQVIIGSISLEPGDDAIWVRITQNQATGPWPWSYGILGWRSAFGYELGTTKAFAEPQGAVQRLGVGLQPVERSGVLTFEPRSFNLAWIKKGNPWSLTFEATTGVQVQAGGGSVTFGVTSAQGDVPWTLNSIGFANLKRNK